MNSTSFDPAVWSLSPIDGTDLNEDLVGLLSFDRERGVQLEIPVGCLHSDEAPGQQDELSLNSYQNVFGYSRSGRYYLLEDVDCDGCNVHVPGMKSERLRATSLLVSRTPLCSNPLVTSIDLYLEGLREWVGYQPVVSKYGYKEDEGILQSYSFEYDVERIVEPIIFEDDAICIKASYKGRMSGGHLPLFTHGFESDYHVSFALKQAELPLHEMMNTWVFPVRDFLAFCMGFRCEVTHVHFATIETRGCELYSRIIGSPLSEGRKELTRMPLPYRRIESNLCDMVKAWLDLKEYARNAAKSYVSLLGHWEMPLSLEFFASAVALEALSHDLSSDTDKKVLLVDEDILMAVKKSNMSRDAKEAVLKELYRPQNSGDLTDELVDDLGEYAEYLVPDMKKFLREHRDARNGHAHLNPKKLKKSPQLHDLYTHTKTVQLLCYGALCMRIGLSAKDALDSLIKSRYMWSSVEQSRKYYAQESISVLGEQHDSE